MCHSPSSPATRKLQAHHPSSLQTQDGQLEPRNPPTHGLDTLNFNNSFLSPEFAPTEMRTVVQGAILIGVGGTAVLLQMAMPGIGAGVERHSNFASRVEDRLRTTLTVVLHGFRNARGKASYHHHGARGLRCRCRQGWLLR
ncbi:hypothetical protein DPSP01_005400 [Paraphaeosphaeria sporulosa]